MGQTRISTLKLPRISQVVGLLTKSDTDWPASCGLTFLRVLTGLLLGGIAGWSLGLLMSHFRLVSAIMDPLVEMVRPVSPVVLIPFAILWLGLGTGSQIAIIALGCGMVILVSTYEAARRVEPRFSLAARSLGASPRTVLRSVIVPAIRPHLLGPVRVAAGTGFGLTVAAEYLGAQGGLGYVIRNARTTLHTDSIALASILIGLEAIFLDRCIQWWWNLRTRWVEGRTETVSDRVIQWLVMTRSRRHLSTHKTK
jgi:ABC-type nitrate/sulfonate/bicarbonate transport system permease component